MKNLFTFLLVLIVSVCANAQEPVQRSLVTKVTATWCPNCGTWGWSFFEGIKEDNQDKAVYIKAHFSGDLQSDPAKELAEALGATGQPNFFFGENKITVGSSSYPAQQSMLKELIDEASTQMPIANTAVVAGNKTGAKIEFVARTQFFQEAEGDFYLSAICTESNFTNLQAGLGADAIHTNIIRADGTESVFGEQIASGSIEKDTEIFTDFRINLNTDWSDDLDIVFIIWNKVGDEYIYVNSFATDGVANLTSTRPVLSGNAYELISNLVEENTQLIIGQNDILGDAKVQLVDLQGRVVRNIWDDTIQSSTVLNITNTDLASGTYILQIQIDNKMATEKIVFLR